jgi:hypothetical protein
MAAIPISYLTTSLSNKLISCIDFCWQAFVNIVLTLCDAGDSVDMFAPYYFNAYMSFQMTGVTDILVGACNPKTLHPDIGNMTTIHNLK